MGETPNAWAAVVASVIAVMSVMAGIIGTGAWRAFDRFSTKLDVLLNWMPSAEKDIGYLKEKVEELREWKHEVNNQRQVVSLKGKKK
jgi:hypothetical protein